VASTIVSVDGLVNDRRFTLIDAETGAPAAPEKHVRWRKALHLEARWGAGKMPTIAFPDGTCLAVNDGALNAMLSDYPRTEYRHAHFPMHVLTTASLQRLAELRQVDAVDVRRFRPTVLIDTGDARGFVEKQWVGRSLRVGAVAVQAIEETTRCGMTFVAQPGVADDPEILRTILRNNKRHLGINCNVGGAGFFHEGDEVFVGSGA